MSLGPVLVGSEAPVSIEIIKEKRGSLTMKISTDVPWIEPQARSFFVKGLKPVTFKAIVRVQGLPAGEACAGKIRFETPWGTREVTVHVTPEPLPLPVGDRTANSLDELVSFLPAAWDDLLRLVRSGELGKWLRLCGYPALEIECTENEALQQWVSRVAPALKPTLHVTSESGDLGEIELGTNRSLVVRASNAGVGSFVVRAEPSAPWMEVPDGPSFEVRASEEKCIEVRVKAEGVPAGNMQFGDVRLKSPWGECCLRVSFLPLPPVLRVGTEHARSVAEVLRLARDQWGSLVDATGSGALERWVRLMGLPSLPPGADANHRVQKWVAGLDPSVAPTLALDASLHDLGRVENGEPRTVRASISNRGIGDIDVLIVSMAPWIALLTPAQLRLRGFGQPEEVVLECEVVGAAKERQEEGTVAFRSPWGEQILTVRAMAGPTSLRDGDRSLSTAEDLRSWLETKPRSLSRIVRSGELDRWLDSNGYRAQGQRLPQPPDRFEAIQQYALQSAGLVAPPDLRVKPAEVRLGAVEWKRARLRKTLRIRSEAGFLYGRIECKDHAVSLRPQEFETSPERGAVEIECRVDLEGLHWGPDHVIFLLLDTNAGRSFIPIRLRVLLDRGRVIARNTLRWALWASFYCGLLLGALWLAFPGLFRLIPGPAGFPIFLLAAWLLPATLATLLASRLAIRGLPADARDRASYAKRNSEVNRMLRHPLYEDCLRAWTEACALECRADVPPSKMAEIWKSYIHRFEDVGCQVEAARLRRDACAKSVAPVLLLSARPLGSFVEIEGEGRRKALPTRIELTRGRSYRLKLTKEGCQQRDVAVHADWEGERSVVKELRPLPDRLGEAPS